MPRSQPSRHARRGNIDRVTEELRVANENAETDAGLLNLANKHIKDKTSQCERLEAEVQELRDGIQLRDTEIQGWREKMKGVARLTSQQTVDLGLDAQAKAWEEKRKLSRMCVAELEQLRKEKKQLAGFERAGEYKQITEEQQSLINRLLKKIDELSEFEAVVSAAVSLIREGKTA